MQEMPGDDFTHTLHTAQNLDCTSPKIQHLNHTQDPESLAPSLSPDLFLWCYIAWQGRKPLRHKCETKQNTKLNYYSNSDISPHCSFQ